MWQQEGLELNTWESALAYCENLNLAGYDDWRLPNINELQSIVDYSRASPALDIAYFHIDLSGHGEYINPWYWSSTTMPPAGTNFALTITFGAGDTQYVSKDSQLYIRAVRNGQVEPPTTTSSTSSTIPSDTTTTTITESTTSTIEGETTTTSTTIPNGTTTTIPGGTTTTTTIPTGNFQILNHMMTKQTDLNDCATPVPTDTFTTKDAQASCWAETLNLKAGDVTVIKWYDPYNNMVGESNLIADADINHGCIMASRYISRDDPPGSWHVDFFHNDIKQFTEDFTIVKSGCLATSLLQDSPAKLEDLRKFRNRVLFKSKKGRAYIRLFYWHSPELTSLILSDYALLLQSAELLKELLPQIKASLSEKPITLTPTMVINIETILNSISLAASPELREVVEMLQSDLRGGKVFEELKIPFHFN
jgi:hypothetical protein